MLPYIIIIFMAIALYFLLKMNLKIENLYDLSYNAGPFNSELLSNKK